MNKTEAEKILFEHDQMQVMQGFDALTEEEQKTLLDQIAHIDWKMISMATHPKKEERGKIEPLGAVEVSEIEERREEFEQAGLETIRQGKVAAVLLAGGMGTRLGSDKPKGMLNVGLTRELYIFECLMNNLMEVTKMAGCSIPLYIMTSDKNHEDTVAFFQKNNYFGYEASDIQFFRQEMAAAVDYNGKLLKEAPGRLATSPNGNGGWFVSMEKAGLLTDIHKRGVEWLNIFAVDNVLQKIADPCFVGATVLNHMVSGGKVVRKADAYEKVGVLCTEDGKPAIVEYYEMTEEMATSRNEKGDLNYNFGVILNYLFRVDALEEIMRNHMPLHIVEKKIPYINENGEYIKPEKPNGYKFETLVVDMIQMMDNCLPYEVVREKEFAPIKNLHGVDSLDTARELMKKNNIVL